LCATIRTTAIGSFSVNFSVAIVLVGIIIARHYFWTATAAFYVAGPLLFTTTRLAEKWLPEITAMCLEISLLTAQ
jgi:hypothetical protein